ncbi:potassium transporter Kef [Philodulcilactobacillus myokoensis]|uniref:Potassium transporter Kef n=1 Tax=Philodulcilactobacillus myokoensis TaxID=2929573 RepID=A0A9W6B2T8_9LACO|nr:potassium channel family protein [Philodulcilactobacillus myokoensis]GLB47323.1 potassium transporter Kef [Philodulcilactobacillus myokoensis]
MTKPKFNTIQAIYNIIVTILITISISMMILDYQFHFNTRTGDLMWIHYFIWFFFLVDYVVGFIISKNKRHYVLVRPLDLIALVPTHPFVVIFRFARIIRIIRYYHLFWKLGWDGNFTKKMHEFLYDTGFISFLYVSIIILIVSALLFSYFENYSMADSLWWAITTATTVGYGDLAPKTLGGRLVAAALMVGGIGFIGLLTSTITNFFTKSEDEANDKNDQIKQLSKQISKLTKEVHSLKKSVNKSNHR